MSVQDTLDFDPGRVMPRGQADTREAPGIFDFDWDAMKASAADAAADVPGRAYERRQGEVAAAAAEFARQTGKRGDAYYLPIAGEPGGNVPLVDEERLFRDIRRYREAGNPDAFKDLGTDIKDFDGRLRQRFRSEDADRDRRMRQGGFVNNVLGGIAGSFTDPINILTMPFGGGGKSVASQIVRNGLLNAGIEAAETPLFIAERNMQGREWTADEMLTNIGLAGLGGAGFDALGKGLGKLPALDAKLYDAVAPIRAVVDGKFRDADMARALREMVPDHALTPQQQAALHVVERAEEVRGSNPFQDTHDAIGAHEAMLDRVMRDFDAGAPLAGPVARTPDAAQPALTPDFDNAWDAIIGIEGGTNRDGSFRTSPAGAIGPAQVMSGTAPEAARMAGLPWDERRYRSDPDYNIALGRAYYREMLRQFDGDPVKAAAAYNAGPGSAARGTGVRGAMARARRAGVPEDWVSYLPRETRGYVANFQKRTGMAPGAAIDGGGVEPGVFTRSPDLDAERPIVFPDRGEEDLIGDLPELRRDLFEDDNSWRVAQAEYEARELGLSQPAVTRQSIWNDARDRLMADQAGEVPGALWHRDVGPIDVLWGNDKSGLAKIVGKHAEVLEELPLLLDSMGVKSRSPNRIVLQSLDHKAVVSLDRYGDDQRWLLSAYQVKGKAPPPAVDRGAGGDARDHSPSAGAGGNIAYDPRALQEAQLSHIGNERARMRELQEVRNKYGRDHDGSLSMGGEYHRRANDLGFHPLTDDEIAARFDELDGMEADALAASPAQRDALEADGLLPATPIDEATAKRFDDAHSAEMQKIADGAWHDIAATVDPETRVDLGDGKGERSVGEIRAELDKDGADIDAIEACLRPPMTGGDA